MSKLIKKYAIISTANDNFFIIEKNLTEDDIILIKYYSDEYDRLWNECYAQERENAKNQIHMAIDLRPDLIKLLNQPISKANIYSISDYHRIWLSKDLIIEHFEPI